MDNSIFHQSIYPSIHQSPSALNRYRSNTPLDDVSDPIGDAEFHRLDMRSDPTGLPPGTVQASENFRFDTQGATVRGGIARQLPPLVTTTEIRFAGVYKPEGLNDRIALVLEDRLTLFNPVDQSVVEHTFPALEVVAAGASVDFIQAGVAGGSTPSAYILRGQANPVLKYDGTVATGANVAIADATFEPGDFGIYYADRIAVNDSPQSIAVSDFLSFTVWNKLSQFKVLYGGDDELVGFLAYQKNYVIVGCKKRFMLAYFASGVGAAGAAGGLVALDSFLRDLTRAGGLAGRRAWGDCNGKIWFLSRGQGIYAFVPQLDNELTVLGEPISKPIQPILDNLSTTYAHTSSFATLGTRLYFAMPICPDPAKILTITIDTGVATVTTLTPHCLDVGDGVQILGTLTAAANGIKTVTSTATSYIFTYATAACIAGARATSQKIVTRPNRIAVFNTALASRESPLGEWESVDTLPMNLFADWLLVADDSGLRRRLWLVDKVEGPFLYEHGDVDEFGSVGGLALIFELEAELSTGNFTSRPIPGRLKSRTLRWGPTPRHVKAAEARLAVLTGDAGSMTATVRTPDRGEWMDSRTFDDSVADTNARKRCGKRGLEAEIEVTTLGGRPTVRSMMVETVPNGRVAEE